MQSDGKRRTTLVFAPHPDDEVLGVGGTIASKAAAGEEVIVCVATARGAPEQDIRQAESIKANRVIGATKTVFLNFPDLGLDTVPHKALTEAISDAIQKYKPNSVFTPHPGDLHTDHKALTAAVLVALRPKYPHIPEYAYTYETLSETGWDYQNPQNCFSPNIYMDITSTLDKKIEALMMHQSQMQDYPGYRSIKAVETLAVYRGVQAGMNAAEAFSIIRGYGL